MATAPALESKAPERPTWIRHGAALAPACLAAALVYGNALGTFFTPDDIVSLSRAAGLEPTPLTFRPLSAVLASRIEYATFGLAPLGYHAVNFMLHLVNVVGVYALALRLSGRSGLAQAASILFATSGIAFTPLHWASGIGDLLACGLLLGATLLHLQARSSGRPTFRWAAALVAFAAALAKETAIAWPLVIAALEWRGGFRPTQPREEGSTLRQRLVPAGAMGLATFLWVNVSRVVPGTDPAYALSIAPGHLARNLGTYVWWCVGIGSPIRDAVAAVDPKVWPTGLVVAGAIVASLRLQRREQPRLFEVGVAWLFAFLLPVLPLAHHTYLYYLYIPWVGGAVSAAALGARAMSALPKRMMSASPQRIVVPIALAAFVAIEGRNVAFRERATFDALPVDRTMRDAMLLSHALPALLEAGLPPGTRVGFVNPAPRPSLDVITGMPTREVDRAQRTSYYPLEAVMMEGKTLHLFVPGLAYAGFDRTIPPGWEDVECFLFEQRGYLRRWGRGRDALKRQAEYLASMGRQPEGEPTVPSARTVP